MEDENKNEEKIFHTAIAKPVSERVAYLQTVCGNNPGLLSHIESLLRVYDARDDFLEVPPWGENITLDSSSLVESPGTVIGRYKLLEKIGEGGMAVVYMTEQTEPIRRKVALKIIKLGMDTKSVIARFEAERQALAMMDHPNIAKVLDAGATETGRPYFVMELVTGVSITEYCDKNNLSTKDRLALFIQVCNAVQHAHQKGIIHRDIKPTNVMVTRHEGQPIPKVIDFGIAKAINQKLTEKTLFTRYAHIIGTPAYMSPEQAELSDMDIDTRTDIYSLGVLLYELLTGTTPFGEEELRKAGYIEMQRIIREQEPVKPSTRVARASRSCVSRASCPRYEVQGQDALATQNKGGTPSPRPELREVRGDLDWIVMKTLEKDRARRYETVSGLAEDISHHLEHEPVMAGAPGTAYRVQKFLRRHRSQTIAALAMLIIAVAAVVILSMWNKDRRQLAEAEGFRHRGILSQAREQYAKADREAALESIKPILNSKHVGPEARLLNASILIGNRRSDEAVTILNGLINERPEVAGAAHSLFARILWESESPNAEKLKEIEEHRRKAEVLLPETAEAYFLRTMAAVTVKEQLASIDKALQLDPSHYESRRLRTFTYYASRKYEKLKDEALVLTILRPRDSLGHSLRAIALRELGKHTEAIAEYDKAIALTSREDPQYIELSSQRCETLLRMGDYERVISNAEACLKLSPDKTVFQYYIFCGLTALGDYDKATNSFRQIISPSHEAHQQFRHWCAKYVFDKLGAGRLWHPQDHKPTGAAFLPMVEAEETYLELSTKARRLTTDGFSARWSPDGKKLAFSLGVHGYSGVAIFDPATKETELLIVPGKDPIWSPDGKYIAFVRDCEVLRLEELAMAERKNQSRPATNEEVWIMNADGTDPKRLARGGWPSWSQDSTCVYYHSRVDKMLYSISIEDQDSEAKQIMVCSNSFPSVSPDDQRVAYLEGTSLKVRHLASEEVVAEWPVPITTWGGPGWSPAGQELCIGGSSTDKSTGLWIYTIDSRQPAKVLGGQITVGSWSPDGTKLVFNLGPPYFEIWAAGLDLDVSSIEGLGPSQTPDDYFREMLAFYNRRIKADPEDAYAYASRARYHDYLHDRVKANADMRRWSAILSSSDFQAATARNNKRILNGPFNSQFVFSAERPVSKIPLLNVALGQKGRCNMKSFKIPILSIYGMATRGLTMSLIGLCLLSGLESSPVLADFVFGEPENLGPAINSSRHEAAAYGFSDDGLSLAFVRIPPGTGRVEGWMGLRPTLDSPWEAQYKEPVYDLETAFINPDIRVCFTELMSPDGLEAYFGSTRAGGYGGYDIWMMTRETTDGDWSQPVNLGPTVNSVHNDWNPVLSPDGLELYFCDFVDDDHAPRPGGSGSVDLWVTKRVSMDAPWTEPVNLGPAVNSSAWDSAPYLSPDGLLLFFDSRRPGGYGSFDLYMTRRKSLSDPWEEAINLGPVVNTPSFEECPQLSADGSTLYWGSNRPGGYGDADIWQVSIIPIVDLNGDGIVDCADMCIVVDNWGTDEPLCDIGPTPFGDGIVDVQDLIVLAGHLFEEYPPAESVEVNEDNNGGQFELERGQILVVTLESNPSTGYKWELDEQYESILLQLGDVEFKSSDTGDPQTVGAGGWEIFRFRAVRAGQMPLLLLYQRSWEDAEPLNTFIIQVTVN